MQNNLIDKIESYYGEHYNAEQLSWIRKDIISIPFKDYDYFFEKLREKYSNLPKPDKIGKLCYELGFMESSKRTTKDIHSCEKCDNGSIYVFDIIKYKNICLEMGTDLQDLCQLDLCRCSVRCMNSDIEDASIDIHTYLKKIQNIDERQFQYAYISLYQFYLRFANTKLSFDKFIPYNFWGIKDMLKPLFIKDILNENIREELINQHNNR